MKTILEYLVNNHIKKEKKIHSYKDLENGDYYAVDYTPTFGSTTIFLGICKGIIDNNKMNVYICFDIGGNDFRNNVYANGYTIMEPTDKVRNVTDEERALLDDIVSKCNLNGKIKNEYVGYVQDMKFIKDL